MAWLRTTSLVFALALAGCGGGDDGAGGSGGSGATGGSGGTGGAAGSGGQAGGGAGGATPQCATGPGYKETPAPMQVDSLNGKVTDLDGNPAGDTVTTVCGTDICIFGSTDTQGTVVTCDKATSICTPGILPGQAIDKPAFKYGLGLNYAKFALLLPSGQSVFDVGTQTTAKFPAMGSGADLSAGSDASNSGVTVSIPAGAKIKLEPDYITAEEKQFRAVEIPTAKAPEAVDATLGFEMLVATTPVDTHFCPNAKLTVPNSPGWVAGTEVEFWVHGVNTEEDWAPYGGWGKVSAGTVSSDGNSIETADGEGIPLLSVFGIRKKQ